MKKLDSLNDRLISDDDRLQNSTSKKKRNLKNDQICHDRCKKKNEKKVFCNILVKIDEES